MSAPSLTPGFNTGSLKTPCLQKNHVPATLTIRLRRDQRQQLVEAAGEQRLGPYVRSQLFDDDGELRPNRKTRRLSDAESIGRALVLLGQSDLTDNLSELASLARNGALVVAPEACAELSLACAHVAEIRKLLIKALGLRGRR